MKVTLEGDKLRYEFGSAVVFKPVTPELKKQHADLFPKHEAAPIAEKPANKRRKRNK